MLEARALTKTYDGAARPALAALDLTVRPGEVFCLLGANGAGKTTTIGCFLGFVAPSGGQALVDGCDVAADPIGSKQALAYIPEQVTLYRNLSGIENLAYFTELAGHARPSQELAIAALVAAGLTADAARDRVGTYSKGMRQKVGIAIAVAKGAKALLLDEPTSGLDPQASNDFSRLVADMAGRGSAVLMATHDLFRAKESGTRIGIMRGGTLRTTLAAADIGHADLERLYLDHMRA